MMEVTCRKMDVSQWQELITRVYLMSSEFMFYRRQERSRLLIMFFSSFSQDNNCFSLENEISNTKIVNKIKCFLEIMEVKFSSMSSDNLLCLT